MAWFPGARKRPVPGHTDGPMRDHLGAALHVNDSVGNLFNWVRGDHDMSCHFEVYRDGSIEQYLDTATSSWCQQAGNQWYVSIETEGYPRQKLTPAQVESVARIMAWLHNVHGIPLRVADHVGDRGLITHGAGGAAWGGHTGCPGTKRAAQRPAILRRAQQLVAAGHPHPSTPARIVMPAWPWKNPAVYLGPITGPDLSHGGGAPGDKRMVIALQAALEFVLGAKNNDPRGEFRASTAAQLAIFQHRHGMKRRPRLYRGGWRTLRTAVAAKEKHR